MSKTPSLEITMAKMSVTIEAMASDIAEIKARMDVMDANFARKDDVEKNSAAIILLKNDIQTQEVKIAVQRAEFRVWGIVGGIIVTLVAAAISAIEIHL